MVLIRIRQIGQTGMAHSVVHTLAAVPPSVHVCKYVDQKETAQLPWWPSRSQQVSHQNLKNLLHAGDEVHKQGDPLWLWNPEETSPEVQNRVISGPTWKTDVPRKLKKKRFQDLVQGEGHCMAPMVNGLSAFNMMLEFHLCGFYRDMPNLTVDAY